MNQHRLWLILIPITTIAFLLVFFIPGLGETIFSIDDSTLFTQGFLRNNWSWQSLKILLTPGFSPDFYPLRDISVWVDWSFTKDIEVNTTVPKIQNLLWLLGIAGLSYLVLKRITHNRFFSLVMSCAWLLHPFHLESLNWISARKDLMSWFFILSSVLFLLPSFDKNEEQSPWNLPLACLFFFLSLLCKAGFLLLPFAFAGWLVWKVARNNSVSKKLILWTSLACVLSMLFVLLNYWNYTQNNYMQMTELFSVRFISVMAALGRNIMGIFVPYFNAVDVEPWGGWYVYNKNFAPLGIAALLIFLSVMGWALIKGRPITLLICALIVGILAMTPGFNPKHRNFYSIRYFEPVFFVLWLWASIYLAQSKRALQFGVMILLFFALGHALDAPNWQSNFELTKKSYNISPTDPSLRGMFLMEYYNQATWGRLSKSEMADYKALFQTTLNDCVISEQNNGRCLAFMSHLEEFADSTGTTLEDKKYLMERTLNKSVAIKKEIFSEVAKSEIAWNMFRFKMSQGVFDKDALRDYFEQHKFMTDDYTRVRFLIFQCLEFSPERSQAIYADWATSGIIGNREVYEFIGGLKHKDLQATAKKCLKLNK